MHDGEALLAWVLFWIFTAITTVSTFLIVDHHRTRRLATALAALVLTGFLVLYFALRYFLEYLGL